MQRDNPAANQRCEVQQYVPSLISVPKDERSLEQLKEDVYNEVRAEDPKTMLWPLRVPPLPPTSCGHLQRSQK